MKHKVRNSFAIAALVCGLLSWFFGALFSLGTIIPNWGISSLGVSLLLGILAIVFGAVALVQIKKGSSRGRWMAITGIICGSIDIIGFVVMIIAAYLQGHLD